MRLFWGAVVMVSLSACQQCGQGMPDAGEVGGGEGGGSGGGGEEMGGGGGIQPDLGLESDAGPRLVGCEVDAGTFTTPECMPSASGCQSSTDCSSGLCLKLSTGGVCTSPCGDGGGCQPDWSCQRRWTALGEEGFCVPARRTP